MMPIATWHRNCKPNMNNDEWCNTISTADEILKDGMILSLIGNAFCKENHLWASTLEKLFKMHHVCVCSFFQKGTLTPRFIKRCNLALEHINPEDHKNHPAGSLAAPPPHKNIFEVDPDLRKPNAAAQAMNPATEDTKHMKPAPEDMKCATEDAKHAAQVPKSTENQNSKPAASTDKQQLPDKDQKSKSDITKENSGITTEGTLESAVTEKEAWCRHGVNIGISSHGSCQTEL